MRSIAVAAVVVALIHGPASGAVAAPKVAERAETYTFAFHDAEIADVAEAILGKALGLSYTVDPAITGKMSFRIDQRLTGAQLLEAFEAALESSSVAMVRQGDSLALKPRSKARDAASLGVLADGAHAAGFETVAAPLQYAAPSEVAKALQSVSSQDPVVFVDDKQGLLILGGTGSELAAAVKIIRLLDHSGLEDAKIRFFDLSEAPAQTVADDLNHILTASNVTGVTIAPLKRLNGLFVFARTTQALDEVGRWILKLDVPSRDKSTALFVYHPRNLSAASLGATLGGGSASSASTGTATGSSLSSGATSIPSTGSSSPLTTITSTTPASSSTPSANSTASSGAGGGGGLAQAVGLLSSDGDPVRLAVDKDTNTLLFSASPSRWIKIQRILDELDRPPGQVLIEASILEVTLTEQFSLGVDWTKVADNGKLTVGAVTNAAGTVGASYPGLAVTYLDHGLSAAVNALGGKTAVEVVSSPKVLALDNQTASLTVGDQVPIVTQTGQSTTAGAAPIVSNIDYRSTGVILNVTPRISGDDRIFLDISQEVSSVSETTTSTIDSPTILERKIVTTLVLDNGGDRKSTRLNSSHNPRSRMPSSA